MTDHSDPNTSTFEVITDESVAEYREKAEREAQKEALKPEFERLREQVAGLEDPDEDKARANSVNLLMESLVAPPGGGIALGQVIALLADYHNWMEEQGLVLAAVHPTDPERRLVRHVFQSDTSEMVTQFVETLNAAR